MKAETIEDRFKYYTRVLIYIDSVITIYYNVFSCVKYVNKYFSTKLNSIRGLSIYLRVKLKKLRLDNGIKA